MADDVDKIGQQTLTVNSLVKWGGILVSLLTLVVSIVWTAAGFRQDITELRLEQRSQREYLASRKDINEARFAKLEARVDSQDRWDQRIESKLDVIGAVLDRIDKKLGSP